MPVVVDASALVEVLVDSPVGRRTLDLLEQQDETVAPDLLDAEVHSALAGRVRDGRLTLDDAEAALDDLASTPVMRLPHAPLLTAAWHRRHNLTVYDALYVELAAEMRCALVTADARLARAPGLGIPVTVVA